MIFIMIIWLDNQLDSTGPVRSIGDQLLQTMGEIYQQVDLGDNGGAVGRAGIFGMSWMEESESVSIWIMLSVL